MTTTLAPLSILSHHGNLLIHPVNILLHKTTTTKHVFYLMTTHPLRREGAAKRKNGRSQKGASLLALSRSLPGKKQ